MTLTLTDITAPTTKSKLFHPRTVGGSIAAVLVGQFAYLQTQIAKVQADVAVLQTTSAIVVADSTKRIDKLESQTIATDKAVNDLARALERQNTILERIDKKMGVP